MIGCQPSAISRQQDGCRKPSETISKNSCWLLEVWLLVVSCWLASTQLVVRRVRLSVISYQLQEGCDNPKTSF